MFGRREDKKSDIQEILKSMEDKDGNNRITLSCLAGLARNMKQQEDVLKWIKWQSIMAGSVLFIANIAILLISINMGSQILNPPDIVFVILLEVVAVGMFLMMKWGVFRQMDKYQADLHEDSQFWMMAGLITKTKEETELYECMIESEIRRREKEKHQK